MQRSTTSTGKEANSAKNTVTHTPMAPGARIVVRDEEWLVRRVDPASDGGRLLTCDGVSDLVRGQSSLFLTALEGPIEILDPAETQLVADPSPMFNAALLAIESQRRRTMPNDAKIHLGHRAVPTRARVAGAAPAPQPHLDRRCGGAWQDAGSWHSGH